MLPFFATGIHFNLIIIASLYFCIYPLIAFTLAKISEVESSINMTVSKDKLDIPENEIKL